MSEHLKHLEEMLQEAIERGAFPGCNLAIVKKDGSRYLKSFGLKAKFPQEEANDITTLYDMASCSKVVSTTTSVMLLLEAGKFRLNDSIKMYLPEFALPDITVWDCLTHTSGLIPDLPTTKGMNRAEIVDAVLHVGYDYPRHSHIRYSDLNFVLLGLLTEKISGMGLDEFAAKNIFTPLQMKDTGYNPADTQRCAPTEDRGDRIDRGYVHDEMAHRMGGVAGHAGLFSTVDDIANFMEMYLNNGNFRGKRFLNEKTVELFCRPQAEEKDGVQLIGERRALGWEAQGDCTSAGDYAPASVISHTGFTGTNIVIDRENGFGFSLLSNRVHPSRRNYLHLSLRSAVINYLYLHLEEILKEF